MLTPRNFVIAGLVMALATAGCGIDDSFGGGDDADGKADGFGSGSAAYYHSSHSPLSADQKAALATAIETFMTNGKYPGVAVTVVNESEILFGGGIGYADVEHHKRVDWKNHLFQSGSLTKMFVSLAIFHLIATNHDYSPYWPGTQLSVDTRIADILPWYNDPRLGGITVDQLLRHRSGLTREVDSTHTADLDFISTTGRYGPSSPEARQIVVDEEKIYPDDLLAKYSNHGFYLLGEVIVQVAKNRGYYFSTGTYYEQIAEYIRKEVIRPLGLSQEMYFSTPDAPVSRMATGYSGLYPADEYSSAPYRYVYPPMRNGASYQTVSGLKSTGEGLAKFAMQLLRWHRGNFSSGVIGPAEFAQMMSMRSRSYTFTAADSNQAYGAGYFYDQMIVDLGSDGNYLYRPLVGHSGSSFGGRTLMLCEPIKSLCFSVSFNDSEADRHGLGRILLRPFLDATNDNVAALDPIARAIYQDAVAGMRAKVPMPEEIASQLPQPIARASIANLRQALADAGQPDIVDSLLSAPYFDSQGIGYAFRKRVVAVDAANTPLTLPVADESAALLALRTGDGAPSPLFLDAHQVTGEVILRQGYIPGFAGYPYSRLVWENEGQHVTAVGLDFYRGIRAEGPQERPIVTF